MRTASQVNAMECCLEPRTPINYHKIALELSSQQSQLEGQLTAMALNVTNNEQATSLVRDKVLLLGKPISYQQALISGLSGKLRNLSPWIRRSSRGTKLLLNSAKSSAARITHVINRGRKLLDNLEMNVSVNNLVVLQEGRDLLNEISLVDFTEQKKRSWDSLDSANQTALISRIVLVESERLYEAAKMRQSTITMLKEIVVKVDMIQNSWDEVRMQRQITRSLDVNTITPLTERTVNRLETRLRRVEWEIRSALEKYNGVNEQLKNDGDGLELLKQTMKWLNDSQSRTIELAALVVKADCYRVELENDVQKMKGYYEDLIEEGHPVVTFLHYVPRIVNEVDLALSHGKSVRDILRGSYKKSKQLIGETVTSVQRSVDYMEKSRNFKKILKDLSELPAPYSSDQIIFDRVSERKGPLKKDLMDLMDVGRTVAELEQTAVLRIKNLVRQSRLRNRKTRRNEIRLAHLRQELQRWSRKVDSLIDTRSRVQHHVNAITRRAARTETTLQTAISMISGVNDTQQDTQARLKSFEEKLSIVESIVKKGLSDSRRLKKEVLKKKRKREKKKKMKNSKQQ
jgi:hypothetical protein